MINSHVQRQSKTNAKRSHKMFKSKLQHKIFVDKVTKFIRETAMGASLS